MRAGKRKAKEGEGEGAWSATRAAWCGAACGALAAELSALWPLARRYFAGELAGEPNAPQRHADLKVTGTGSLRPDSTRSF